MAGEINGEGLPAEVIRTKEHHTFDVPAEKFLVDGRLQLYEETQKRGYFQIRASGDKLIFQAGGSIGLIPVNDRITIEVAPRTPIANLDRLLRIANADSLVIRRITRSYGETSEELSLVDVLCDDLVEAISQIASEGRRKTYEKVKHAGSPRSGRILVKDTLRATAAHPGRLTVVSTRFERTSKNAYNACLKRAVEQLAHVIRVASPRKGSLARLRQLNDAWRLVADADVADASYFAVEKVRSDLAGLQSEWYRRALSIAVAVLQNRRPSAQEQAGTLTLSSVIYDLSVAFESYVRNVLAAAANDQVLDGNLSPPQGAKTRLFSNPANTELEKIPSTPDIVLTEPGKPWCTIDVKYKPYTASPSRDDLNQVLTYSLGYDVENCMLIYPAAKGLSRMIKLGEVGPKSVYCYGIDLLSDDLPAEEKAMVDAVFALKIR
jgi:5-methylcytosine-specific restriction enzyme subunit McrC